MGFLPLHSIVVFCLEKKLTRTREDNIYTINYNRREHDYVSTKAKMDEYAGGIRKI